MYYLILLYSISKIFCTLCTDFIMFDIEYSECLGGVASEWRQWEDSLDDFYFILS